MLPMNQDQPPRPTGTEGVVSPFGVVGVCTAIVGVMMPAVLPWVTGHLAFEMALGVGLTLVVLGGLVALASRRKRTDRMTAGQEPA